MSNELVLPNGVDKLSVPQKAVALGFLGGALYFVGPILAAMMVNLMMIVVIGVPLLFLAYNYEMIWLLFKNLSWHTTKFLIGLDVLSYMDRYYEWVESQERVLLKSKETLEAEVISVSQQVDAKEKSWRDNMNRADVAEKHGNTNQREIALSQAQDDKEFIATLTPVRDDGQDHVEYLNELVEVFNTNKQKLRYKIDSQKSKYKALKAMSGGLRAAASAIGGTGQNQIWNETQNQLISQMNQFTASIHTFENVLKPAIEAGRFDKQLRQEEGVKLLQEFRQTNFEVAK